MMIPSFLRAALFLLVACSCPVWAGFPDRPVHIVVPFPTGATADAATRVIARKLAELWGQPVIVENRPGAPGVQAVATAAPDGYTLLLGNASLLATAPLLNPKLPYKVDRDFVPVGQLMSNNPVLVIAASSGIKSIKELVDQARAKPEKFTYSSAGIGSTNYLMMELFQSATGTKMVHIPYKGGGQQVTDVMGRHVDVSMLSVPSVLTQVKSGGLRALAIVGPKRDRALPDVPTMAEAGARGVEYSIWFGLYAPAKTPASVVHKVGADLQRALGADDVVNQITSLGGDPVPLSPVDFARYVASETVLWADLIKKNKLTAD
jgi:tripartite-type tricarboxylate transporter receptor subunit TctC